MTDALGELVEERGFVLLVSIPGNRRSLAEAAFDGGADGIKVHLNVSHRASGLHFGTWSDEKAAIQEILKGAAGPVGVMPGSETVPSRATMEEMQAAGIAFFDAYLEDTPAWMLELTLPWMAAVGPAWSAEQVRALEELGMAHLEASIVDPGDYGHPLTVQDLVRYRTICSATTRPVVVPSQKKILPRDVAPLRRAGVRVLLLGAISLGNDPEAIRERLPAYRDAIEASR